eukprot:TRINITY_DN50208_c0_g1_i1.p1 TRINITY_DN50208_c0_g1~~TRINITY_DN50208_c0_g1_i1.p1  ORF type:complete len:287 (+),score=63.78 TRINITY_DN50208_c0_g1_i1:116-976(+)
MPWHEISLDTSQHLDFHASSTSTHADSHGASASCSSRLLHELSNIFSAHGAVPFAFGKHRRAAAAAFLDKELNVPGRRTRGLTEREQQAQQELLFDKPPLKPKPSDEKLKPESEEEVEESAPEHTYGPVKPPHPPKPSAISGLHGEKDGPRPKSDLIDKGRIGKLVAESRGYVNANAIAYRSKTFPPAPRVRGDLGLPKGPVPDVKIYAKAHWDEDAKANDDWTESVKEHEEALKKAGKMRRMRDFQTKVPASDDDEDNDQESDQLYNSPNANNVIPPELRTGLES